MTFPSNYIEWLSNAWAVLVLFVIPIGGGIPAGVVLAQSRGLEWSSMMAIYFVSDLILAVCFEPIMHAFRRAPFFAKFNEALKASMQKTILRHGIKPGPFALIMIAFGADPMTGRATALAAGHGFLSGWTFAITGDMMFFALVMTSTLWLNRYLGDGTWTAIIITVAMIGIPYLFRRFREWRESSKQATSKL
jgi:hypothetical protein